MRTSIFPFKEQYAYLLDSLPVFRPNLQIISVVVPNAFRHTGGIPDDLFVYHRLNDALNTAECVIFLPMDDPFQMNENILMTMRMGKNVICGVELPKATVKMLRENANQYNVSFEYEDTSAIIDFLEKRSDVYTQQESIIIAIGALTQGIDTCHVITKLNDALTMKGYRVGIIAIRPELRVLGVSQLPVNAMIESNLDHTIVQINRFFNYYQLKKRPNIILLQLPDEGLYRVSNDYETCFGARTYLVSQAIDIDYCIMLMPFIDMDTAVLNVLSEVSRQRYGFEYNSICIEHKVIDLLVSSGTVNLRYLAASDVNVNRMVDRLRSESSKDTLYFDSETDWIPSVAEDVIDQLS